MNGIFVERVAVTGEGLPTASIDFADGLNVVAGASDTGKSYLASLIDYAFGASSSPRAIDAARGYSTVTVTLRERRDQRQHEITRTFGSPRATVRTLAPDGTEMAVATVPARHSAVVGSETLSSILLRLSGLSNEYRIRRNAQGEVRGLSFRDIAYLCVVHEARIIAERPPFRSENPTEHTTRAEVLRLLVGGRPAPEAEPAINIAGRREDDGIRIELLRDLIREAEAELGQDDVDVTSLTNRMSAVEAVREESLAEYEASSAVLLDLQARIAAAFAALRDIDARITVADGLEARFALLNQHYESDVERLTTITEAGHLLGLLPIGSCPVCGSDPEHHRPEQVAEHFAQADIHAAAEVEQAKTERLLAELDDVISGIASERHDDLARRAELRTSVSGWEAEIESQVAPRLHASADELRRAEHDREEIARAILLFEQIAALRSRVDRLSRDDDASVRNEPEESAPMSQVLHSFLIEVETMLRAWNVPGGADVSFSDTTMDLLISGETRASHGKGMRALTCAAFILGLLRHARIRDQPHPGIVVLDSPLVAYKQPDPMRSEAGAIVEAGVKDAFYRSLGTGLAGGQVIVLENEEPSDDLKQIITYHHFSKGAVGRYGFFPARGTTEPQGALTPS